MEDDQAGIIQKNEIRKIQVEEEFDGKKSPKSPKLSEEMSEMSMSIKAPGNEEDATEDEVDDSVYDNMKIIISEIIENCPAGQVEIVSSLCCELFGQVLQEFIEKKSKEKMIKDGIPSEEEEDSDYNVNLNLNLNESGSNLNFNEVFHRELKCKLSDYVKELFPGTGTFSITAGSNSDEWNIQILGQRLKPKAFWSGHWHSKWIIKFKEIIETPTCQNVFSLNGKIDLNVHYHEEGSVQLSAEKEISSRADFKAETPTQAADKIYWKIKDSEDAVQLALNEAYQELAESIFKKLRRQLPVTRTKMDWGKFANYQLSSELKK